MTRLRTFSCLTLIVALLLPVASCSAPITASSSWTADDIRYLDPAGDSPSPSTDILAIYTRTIGADFEIRLDLLDLPLTPNYNLTIALNPLPSNANQRIGINIPAQGFTTAAAPGMDGSKIIPRIVRDPWLDTVTVRFNRRYLPKDFLITVNTFRENQAATPDNTAANISPASKAPAARASVLIAFTDTFPAATPAQALRRWDGAHTGPTGERHGLRLVLDGVRANNLPVALLDLKTPSSLAALNFLGALGDVRALSKKDLLILPDVAFGEPVDNALDLSRRAAKGFYLPSSPFVYAPNLVSDARYQFISLPDTTHVSTSGNTRLIPTPATNPTPQATMDGPSLEVRRALMDLAFSNDAARLLILGGSLPDSTWGQADCATPTFAWLAAHPWVHVLAADNLKTFPVGASDQLPASNSTNDPLLTALQSASKNAITDSAWQTYLMLTAPTDNPALHNLRLNYLDQVGTLMAASRWANRPFTQFDCSSDPDLDSQPECILANQKYLAIIETGGARLTHLFYGEHQLVGPTAQFTIGLSDPSEWNKFPGDSADPGQVMGAFFDESQPYQQYTASWPAPNTLTFTGVDGSRMKTFRLTKEGLEVVYQVTGPVSTKIPLAVNPQVFFSGPSAYGAIVSTGSWTWGPADWTQVRVRTNAALSAISFTDSLPFLGLPEDPNVEYPQGHYLPFPISLVTVSGAANFRVQIDVVK